MQDPANPEQLTLRLGGYGEMLRRVHAETRIPLAELVRYSLDLTLTPYFGSKGALRRDDLVEDVASWHGERRGRQRAS